MEDCHRFAIINEIKLIIKIINKIMLFSLYEMLTNVPETLFMTFK